MASTYLSRTISSSGNRKIMTFSAWIKRAINGATSCIFATGTGSERDMILFESDGKLQFSRYSGSYLYILKTNRQFRDTNAWYHLMCVLDTTQGTESNRAKIYVNGVQETSFNTATYPSQDYQTNYNQNTFTQYLGQDSDGNFDFDGCMSHVHYVDGTAYTPSTFGSTDADTGEWSINTSPSVTYGTNGFFLLKDDNAVTDRSGQGNNFTVGAGTLTKTEDNPSNVFATLNPLFLAGGGTTTFSNGNTTGQSPTLQGCAGTSTIGVSSGKYYAEFKQVTETSSGEGAIGICDTYYISNNSSLGGSSSPGYIEYSVSCFGYRNNNGDQFYSSSGSKYTSSNNHAGWSNGDIIMVALDMDNNRVYLGKNGSWNASNTWSSATPSQYITIDSTGFEGNYHFAIGDSSGGNSVTWNANFGNGYFGTTQISSEGTNASGIGKFEYDVPTGYTALSTKGLNL